jgi:hypothetical protein
MKSLLAPIAFLLISGSVAVGEESNPVVVELYTSQGCSSCPPADALMHELVKRQDVIGLALHVDYWDYIGWKDEFADPAHTNRQQGYAQAGGRSMIYTPQMIINGQEDVVGARGVELMEHIEKHRATAPVAKVVAEQSEGQVAISVDTTGKSLTGDYDVFLVNYTPARRVSIKRGELAGETLDYANVVEAWTQIGTWDGQGQYTLTTSLIRDEPAVVLVQRANHGAIVAAARVR